MAAYPDLPVQPQSSEFHARRWNIRSDGWASINTGRSDPPPTETIENSVAWHLRNWLKRHIVTKAFALAVTLLGLGCAVLSMTDRHRGHQTTACFAKKQVANPFAEADAAPGRGAFEFSKLMVR